jgi:hypothetical protein
LDLEREAKSLKSLVHPSIISVLDFDHDRNARSALLKMELAETILAEDSGSIVDLLDLIHQRQLERSVTHTSIIDQREADI